MAKKNIKKTTETKNTVKTTTAKDTPKTKEKVQTPPTPPVVETPVEEVKAEVVTEKKVTPKDITPKNIMSRKDSGLDANHQVELLGLASKFFHDDPNAADKFGHQVVENMNRITAAGIVVALADEAVNGTSLFSAVMNKSAYPMLVAVAKDMGITLPEIKSLELKGDDEVVVNSSEIKVDDTVKEELKSENTIEEKGVEGSIEIDPVKVAHMGEDALKEALKYLLVTNLKHSKSIKDALVETVDFMHDYRIELARQAENSTEAMNAYEDRTMYEWLTDIFSYVEPTIHMRGIGQGMWALVEKEHSPLSAFLILRGALTDKETKKPCWDDQSIADTTRAFVELICKNNIEKEKEAIATLDPKKKGYRDLASAHETQIKRNEEVLKSMINISFDIVDNYNTDEKDEQKTPITNMAFGRLRKQYYPECDLSKHYEGLYENMKIRGGIILNMFRNPGDKNNMYSESAITEVKEISYTEMLKKKEEAKAAEDKKQEVKND